MVRNNSQLAFLKSHNIIIFIGSSVRQWCYCSFFSTNPLRTSPSVLVSGLVSTVFQACTAQALASCWFISIFSSFLEPRGEFLFVGSRPSASASSKVDVRGFPRVSGNRSVNAPIIKARIPTISYKSGDKRYSNYCGTICR